jgi:Arc/MetJ-type ribon-helix-helix transcriptional regulator
MPKKLITLNDELVSAIEQWRRQQTLIPNQSEAIRTILKSWLTVNGYMK